MDLPCQRPVLASPSTGVPHSMSLPLLCFCLSWEAVPHHSFLLYVFLVCSLLLRIPGEKWYVVPDCTVTAKQRDRRGFQTQLTHGFWGGWRELLSSVIRPRLCHNPFRKTFPPQKPPEPVCRSWRAHPSGDGQLGR